MKTLKVSEDEKAVRPQSFWQSMLGGGMPSEDGGGGGGFIGDQTVTGGGNIISAGNGFWDSLTAGLPIWMTGAANGNNGQGGSNRLILGLLALGLTGAVIYAIMHSRRKRRRK